MPTAWSMLGKARLQQLIGADVLNRLVTLLPALRPGSFDTDQIYSNHGLNQIFEAFSAATQLQKREFRRELFNALPEPLLNQLVVAVGGINVDATFADKVTSLAKKNWTDRRFVEAVSNVLGFPKDWLPSDSKVPPQVQVLEPAKKPYRPLKEYQSSVYHDAIGRLDVERARFIIQMPTGSGKTRTATEIITSFLNSSVPGTLVFWLVHAEELCDQAYGAFEEIWPHVARCQLRLVRCWGPEAALPPPGEQSAFVVGSFQSLYTSLTTQAEAFEKLRSATGLIVIDEAHKVLAPTYRAVTEALIGQLTRVIGLTATPGRGADDEEQNRALAEFFFNQIVTIRAGEASVIDYLKARKVLSETSYVPLLTEQSYKLSVPERAYLEKFFDLPPGVLRRIGNDDVRNVEIVKRLTSETAAGRQVIFFACSVDHSKFICAVLNFLGVKAAHIDGSTPRARRSALVEDFKSSRIQVMCNYGILSTGFDAPKIDVVFISRPTGSIVLYSQMIGRGLRGPAIGGTERCTIIDVKDNIDDFSNEYAVFEHFADYYK